jgi:hypothetical protein
VSGPPKDGFAVANNFCAGAVLAGSKPDAIKYNGKKSRNKVRIRITVMKSASWR